MSEKSSSQSSLPYDIDKPDIIEFPQKLDTINASATNRKILQGLEKKKKFVFDGTWGTAMAFYSWVKQYVNKRFPVNDYHSSRKNRETFAKLSSGLYMPVQQHRPALAKAPGNPWLETFWPGKQHFFIRFGDYLGMNGAWQWYDKGMIFPGLSHKVHPFYGAYFPTRTEHLSLFDRWLSTQPRYMSAIDMGTGCGVLTFYLLKHGVKHVLATDINPNALVSLEKDLLRTQHAGKVTLQLTSFFDHISSSAADLLVFNPPWLPMKAKNLIDKAMYYDENFFDTFFRRSYHFLKSEARMVIIFSNFAQIAGLAHEHPIKKEVSSHHRFKVETKLESPVYQKPTAKKTWLEKIRTNEIIELWVLKKEL